MFIFSNRWLFTYVVLLVKTKQTILFISGALVAELAPTFPDIIFSNPHGHTGADGSPGPERSLVANTKLQLCSSL